MGWPDKLVDYFGAHHYIRPQRALKFGIFWPFYIQPHKNSSVGDSSAGGGGRSNSGSSFGGGLSGGFPSNGMNNAEAAFRR